MNIEKRIDEELDVVGLTRDNLTQSELEQLREQLENEEKGIYTMDGVLSDPNILLRKPV